MPAEPSPTARTELSPGGTLRVALNLANFLLVKPAVTGGEPGGVAADLAHELGRRLGVPVSFVPYETPGEIAAAAGSGVWDVAFIGVEPARANVIDFSAAYLEIESTYLVPAGSPLNTIADVDRAGVRISVMQKSAYELYLTRTLKHAELVHAPSIEASFQQFVDQKLDALSGLKPRLTMDAERLPGSRILAGRFTAVQQGIGTPVGGHAGAQYLREFVEDIKQEGLVAAAIERNGVRGVTVAAAA